MNLLYKISQDVNGGYDTYDSAVVVARNVGDAGRIHPDGSRWILTPRSHKDIIESEYCWQYGNSYNDSDTYSWTTPDKVKVEFIGKASNELEEGTVICSSFNAG